MDREKALEIIATIMTEANLSLDDLLDHLAEDDPETDDERKPMEILVDALTEAKEITGLEDEDIGDIIGVTASAVGHWRRGRTRASRANRYRIYRWLRSVEGALAVRLMPDDFRVNENGDRERAH